MIALTTSTGRQWRAVLAVVLLALFAGLGSPATAAGTGGIEITPVPSKKGNKAITTFRVQVPREAPLQVPYTVRNVEDGPRTARVYSARILRSDGNFILDEPGSSPYVSMPDREVTLAAGQVLEETFLVSPSPDGRHIREEAYAAVVVEVRNGAVVQRASTLIYLDPGPRVPLPLLLVGLAAALVLIPGAALTVGKLRRRRQMPAAEPADAAGTVAA